MINNSGIHPVADNVLVKPMLVSRTTASGIIVASDELNDREKMANTTGVVMEQGPDAGYRVKDGDKVTFAKFSGMLYIGKDGVEYRLMRAEDITSRLDPEMELVDKHLKKGF